MGGVAGGRTWLRWLAVLALVVANAEMRFLWLGLATAVLVAAVVFTRRSLQQEPRDPDPAGMDKLLGMMRAFGAPIGWIGTSLQGHDRTLTAAARRQGVLSIGTELGGGGQVTPSVLKLTEEGMRRLLAHIGAYTGPAPAPGRGKESVPMATFPCPSPVAFSRLVLPRKLATKALAGAS